MLYGPRTSRLRARASSTFPNSQYGLLLPLVPIGIYSPLINYYSYFLVPKEKPATHLGSDRPRVVAGCTTGSHRPLWGAHKYFGTGSQPLLSYSFSPDRTIAH